MVGGGITGVGAALDAATRGLSVGLIEARDYAAGTSSKSSKLIHGGLRYLEMLDFGLVRESLRERELLLTRLAPHLVKPVPFLWPLTHRGWERVYLGAGLALYDRIGGARSVPPATSPVPPRGACGRAGPSPRRVRRRRAVLRRPGGRRAPGRLRRADRACARRSRWPRASRRRASCARASASSGSPRTTTRPTAS